MHGLHHIVLGGGGGGALIETMLRIQLLTSFQFNIAYHL